MRFLILLLSLVASASTVHGSPEALERARSTVKEWAATEKAISREAADWSGRKRLLKDLIEVAEQRIDRLEAELEKGEETLSAADEERARLLEREKAVGAEESRIEDFLTDMEGRLGELRPQLPNPLEKELAPFYRRMPANPAKSGSGLSERMRTVVTLLTKIRQFDEKLTLTESLKTLPGTESTASVRTLYIGLAYAYYLGPGDAGYGVPGPQGWVWQSEPKLRKAVREVMTLAEGGAVKPKFVELPVVLDDAEESKE